MAITWPNNNWVEVDLDYADQVVARAEYTFIFIGPPRVKDLSQRNILQAIYYGVKNKDLSSILEGEKVGTKLIPLGLAQGLAISNSRRRIPVVEIGSELMGFVSDQTTFAQVSIQRLIADNDSFLKKVKSKIVPEDLRDTEPDSRLDFALHGKASKFPFGMALILYTDISNEPIGKLYIENCKVMGISSTVGAGQSILYEGIQIVAHRILEGNFTMPESTQENNNNNNQGNNAG
ncbi:MAG: hypothetical protein DSY42_09400 [Aquifex sp.]|nr:MAG: hypothetical protein DSY42_09400 [Aquifex sp.]